MSMRISRWLPPKNDNLFWKRIFFTSGRGAQQSGGICRSPGQTFSGEDGL